jgi:hypothetical protein
MRRRHIFSGSDQFVLYDFYSGNHVNEDVFAYSNRSGGERGIILFHNKYATTSGWIRFSCAYLRKDVNGGSSLVQRSLAEALEFNGDGRHYYSFRDYATGLSYLRNGRDLWEQGLYVEMGGYEYHAFLDFQEIRDDEYGTWGTLCYRLNGAGVESLEEEVKQVRYGAANDSLRALLGKAISAAAEPDADAQSIIPPLEPLVAGFFKSLVPQSKEKSQRSLLVYFGTEISNALRDPDFQATEDPCGFLLLCAFLALHRSGELSGADSSQMVEAYGLVRPVIDSFGALAESGKSCPHLSREEQFLAKCHQDGPVAPGEELLREPVVVDFLQLHESGGVEWFNKERFEMLVTWLNRVAPYAQDGAPEPVAELAKISNLLQDAAAVAGYRVDRFLKYLKETMQASE